MTGLRVRAVVGGSALLALSGAYCLPGHPGVPAGWPDVASHAGLFAALAAGGWLALRRGWVWMLLAALGLMLEAVQWGTGGYRRMEWADVLANEARVALAALLPGRRSLPRKPRGRL